MQNFMKTIINAVQSWTKKEIKNSTADWNQNNPSADNYVKNRTHWEEETKVVLVDNLTYEDYDYDNGDYPKCTFVIGKKYDVIWNGTLYKDLVCYYDGEYRIIASSENGCPFYIDDDGGDALYIEGDGDWTVSIYTDQLVVHKLDPKYLPELTTTPDWNQNDPEGAGYIKNRPFYEEFEYLTCIPEQDIDCSNYSEDGDFVDSYLTFSNGIPWDAICRIVFDDVVYDDIAAYENSATMDTEIAFTTVDGYEIVIAENHIFMPSILEGRHTIKVEQKFPTVHPIDNKYLGVPVYNGDGENSICLNDSSNIAFGSHSHAEGCSTIASGDYSHAEGCGTIAGGECQNVIGRNNIIEGRFCDTSTGVKTPKKICPYEERSLMYYADGYSFDSNTGIYTLIPIEIPEVMHNLTATKSVGYYIYGGISGTVMYESTKSLDIAFSSSSSTTPTGGVFIQRSGLIHSAVKNTTYAHVVGNGTSSFNRSNAHTLDWNGVGWYQGGLQVGGNAQDDGAKNVLLEGDAVPMPNIAEVGQFLVVKAVDENGKPTEWELDYTNKPNNHIILKDAINGYEYIVSMQNGNLVSSCKLGSIQVTTAPTKTNYIDGEPFDSTNMVVTAAYQDGTTKIIDNYTYDEAVLSGKDITISYKEHDVVYTTTISTSNFTVVPFDPAVYLIDFDYTENTDGTYTITGWKQTLNGEPSTEMIIPNNSHIIL